MKCLIIAAGKGERIRDLHESKPLLPIDGTPLIERVMHAARDGGVSEFVVVTGFMGEQVRSFLDRVSERSGVPVIHVVNEEWHRPNGLSVLCARDVIDEPFLLTMCDHLFDPGIVQDLLAVPIAADETVLAVDYDLDSPLVDPEDATRVQEDGGRIRRLGKGIDTYNAYDTGLFYATPALFDALAESEDESLSGGMNVLAAKGRARAMGIGGRFWVDVDDRRAADLAERHVRGGPTRLPAA